MIIPNTEKKTTLLVALIAVIFLGVAIYVMRLKNQPKPQNQVSNQIQVDADVQKLQTQSSSDDTASIEKDLKDTDLTNLDKELNDIQNQVYQ